MCLTDKKNEHLWILMINALGPKLDNSFQVSACSPVTRRKDTNSFARRLLVSLNNRHWCTLLSWRFYVLLNKCENSSPFVNQLTPKHKFNAFISFANTNHSYKIVFLYINQTFVQKKIWLFKHSLYVLNNQFYSSKLWIILFLCLLIY